MTELRQTTNYAKYMELIGWNVDMLNGVYVYSRKLPILGYFSKIQRPNKILDRSHIDGFIKKYGVFVIQLEPLNEDHEEYYINMGYKKTASTSLPSKTIIVDLRKSEKYLLERMHYKTRYNIKHAKNLEVKVELIKDVELFSEFWHQTARKRGMILSLDKEIKAIFKAFGKNAKIYSAYKETAALSMILTLDTKETTHYMYAGATEKGKKVFAPTLVAWEAMLNAKRRGMIFFDFEGIYDERFPIKSWKGFTRFKKRFGGTEKNYPGIIRRYYFLKK